MKAHAREVLGTLIVVSNAFLIDVSVATSGATAQELIWRKLGDVPFDSMGTSAAMLGDLDGDGLSEVAGGAIYGCGLGGLARVFQGRNGAGWFDACGVTSSTFGCSIDSIADVDGDGIRDLLVGAKTDSSVVSAGGRVALFSGATGALIRDHFGAKDDTLGTSVVGLSDLDLDGVADYAAGMRSGKKLGAVAIYSGATGNLIRTLLPKADGDDFGDFTRASRDANGDGVEDLVVSDPRGGPRSEGSVWVFSGLNGSELHRFDGENPSDQFGMAIADVDDLDGDGCSDLLVGAPRFAGSSGFEGKLYLYSGKLGNRLFSIGGSEFAFLGSAVAGIGDVNDDGTPDVLATSNGIFGAGTHESGAVILFSGERRQRMYHWSGTANHKIADALSCNFDLTGDGRNDAVFGVVSDHQNGGFAGAIDTYRMHPFYVDAIPKLPNPADTVILRAGDTAPGSPVGIALVELNGAPTFQWLILGVADASGGLASSGKVPNGTSGIELTLRAYAIGFSGRLVAGNDEVVKIQ